MLTFRHIVFFGMLVALVSCGTSKKVVTTSEDVHLDLRSMLSQLDSSSHIIDASGLRIELRYNNADPREAPSRVAESNPRFCPDVFIYADSFHLGSTEIFRVDKLDSCAIHDDFQHDFKKDFHCNNLSYILISVLLLIVVITVCKKVLV